MIKPILLDLVKETDPEPESCKGLVFRCEQTGWVGSDKDVNFRERYRFLVRKSCPGCSKCEWMFDDLWERLSDSSWGWNSIRHEGENGKLYKLVITNISKDWETGLVDDYDLEFEPIEEQ